LTEIKTVRWLGTERLNEQEMEQLFADGQVYTRRGLVRAVILTEPVTIETRDGSIVNARPGDYLIRNIEGNKGVWLLPWDYFEENFERYEEGKASES
jgi:hypothetical protein